jgi:hypothetical protein
MALPPSTIDIGQPLLLPSPPGIVIAILVYYDFPFLAAATKAGTATIARIVDN